MKLILQVMVVADGGDPVVLREVFSLERGALSLDTLGLGLAEGKDLLAGVQAALAAEQVSVEVAAQAPCPDCGTLRRCHDTRTIVMRTLFGTLRLPSPRWIHCSCRPQETATFSPVAAALAGRSTPELVYLEARFAAVMSFGLTVKLLGELLPLGRTLYPAEARRHVHAVAGRLEHELGAEQATFTEAGPDQREDQSRPARPLIVGIDGGYVHRAHQNSRRAGWFEVIVGKAIPADGPAKCFGFVQTHDTKPKRRLFELLCSQGMQPDGQVTFFTDGADDVRNLPRHLNPEAVHILDWFHVTMRITVMNQMAKSQGIHLPDRPDLAAHLARQLERLKWFLWNGNVTCARETVAGLADGLDVDDASPEQTKLVKELRKFAGYIEANAGSIPDYGKRYRAGETISTAFVESTVNQVISKRMVKKQQMKWTPSGAHLLLQVRTRVLNDDLAADFHRWYPNFTHTAEQHKLAA